MAHAPECSGRVYGCLKCGRTNLTIDETFDHVCVPNPDHNVQTDSTFRVQHELTVTFPILDRHGDLLCPVCRHGDLSLCADDGEADLADWWECQTYNGGCGASGALVQVKDNDKTQNGLSVDYMAFQPKEA